MFLLSYIDIIDEKKNENIKSEIKRFVENNKEMIFNFVNDKDIEVIKNRNERLDYIENKIESYNFSNFDFFELEFENFD